jgi:hypothetical protein
MFSLKLFKGGFFPASLASRKSGGLSTLVHGGAKKELPAGKLPDVL